MPFQKKLLTKKPDILSGPTTTKSYQQTAVDKFMANNLAIQNIFRIFMGGFFLKKKNY